MKKKKKIYEGTSKKIYAISNSDQLIQEFKDEAPGFDGATSGVIKGKGIINNDVSALLFSYLEGFNIPTHFVKNMGGREMLVKQLEMVPLEIVLRNIAAGSFCERYGFEQGKELISPIIEFYLKDVECQNPMLNQTHIIAMQLATIDEVRMIERMTSKINAVLKSFFSRRNFKLIDFKLEYGRYKNKIVLGDELSLDTCRLWDVSNEGKDAGDRFQIHQRLTETAYAEIKERIFQ